MNAEIATLDEIQKHLDLLNLDIRISKYGRWIDQKVTPDILCALAETILSHCAEDDNKQFTMATMWDDPKLHELMTVNFSKPSLNNTKARNEYDKVISQPLLTLAYAEIINKSSVNRRNFFTLNPDAIRILKFIALRERNAYEFLCIYIKKVLKDSGLWNTFENFLVLGSAKKPSVSDFVHLKEAFEDFTHTYTPINGKDEPRRIFTKVINPLAYQYQAYGTRGGHLTKTFITYSELLYNRENFRDIGKNKNLTREEFEELLSKQPSIQNQIKKAKDQVRLRHRLTEVNDGSEVTQNTEIHHIFMEHEKPELAAHYENLINLTSNQHRNKAHPNSNFSRIDNGYQKLCLLSKLNSVEISESERDSFYSKRRFVEVLNVGFGEEIFSQSHPFNSIRSMLDNYYQEKWKLF